MCVAYSKDMPAPSVYRKWAAIQAVGAAAELRLWSMVNGLQLYPNLFVFLVGPPGTGKSVAIKPVTDMLRKSGAVRIAPTDATKQGLLDVLKTYHRAALIGEEAFDFHYMTIAISELSDFMPMYDPALAGLLTSLFDCPSFVEESKRGMGDPVIIEFPGLSFIMGTATQNLGDTIPEAMWGSGFMARVILVYSSDAIKPPNAETMFSPPIRQQHLADEIELRFRALGELKGEMIWTWEAQQAIYGFWTYDDGKAPLHNRLAHYNTRRWMHLAKLCMIHALSDERMVIEYDDFQGALHWLRDAEKEMPEVFKDMVSHEDGQIYEEMRTQVFVWYNRGDRRPISREAIVRWVSKRVAHHAVDRVMSVAEAGGFINRVAGTSGATAEYTPGAPSAHRDLGVV